MSYLSFALKRGATFRLTLLFHVIIGNRVDRRCQVAIHRRVTADEREPLQFVVLQQRVLQVVHHLSWER
jgi:hypothetical protein